MQRNLGGLVAGICVFACSAAFAVDKGKARYIGGTIAGIEEKTEGPIDLKGSDKLVWNGDKGKGRIEVQWTAVDDLEYGQKTGRRIKTAIFLSPVALFSKARKHFVTFSYKDAESKDQAIVFEFDKDDIRPTLAILKARTGKEITYQDEEARKQMGGGGEKK